MRLAVGADHAGFELKAMLLPWLESAGHQVVDLAAFLYANFIPEPRFQRRLDKLLLVEKKWRGENTS